MTLKPMRLLLALACGSAMTPIFAQMPAPTQPPEQAPALEDLTALDPAQLRRAIEARFDQALSLSRDPAVVAADSARYIWAVEAKVQCGIALGYLKSGFRDPTSLGKCATFAAGMNRQPAAIARAAGAADRRPALSGQGQGPGPAQGSGAQALAEARTGRAALASPAGADRPAPTHTAR